MRGKSRLTDPKPTLNIGCGKDPWGDVRIDVQDGTRNVMADAQFLPFREKVFESSRAFHVLEHCKEPWKVADELRRVTSGIIHAKFPYKWDRIPFVLGMIFSLSPATMWNAIHDTFWHVATQIFPRVDHPIAHRWIVQPTGTRRLNKVGIFPFFNGGRKAKYFRRFSRFMPAMNAEWECWFYDRGS